MSQPPATPAEGLSLSAKSRRTGEQPISFLIDAAMNNPGLINLAAGLVDPLTLPVEATAKLVAKILSEPARGRAALQYDTTLGLAPLRAAALAHVAELEGKPAGAFGVSPAEVLVTTGSQQALYLIGDALIDPGDIVIAANPCYFVYTSTLASFGATVLTAPMDGGGLDVDAVGRLLARLDAEGRIDRVKLIYVTSYFQNPTGLTLSAERRPALLELARRYGRGHRLLILEDAAYRELRYDGPALPSVKSLDPHNRHTILTQTFSKPFAPGLKTGYTLMPADLMDAVLRQKGNHDFGSASLTQHVALEAMRDGSYAEQVKTLSAAYRRKRDAMLSALTRCMPPGGGATWTKPDGGLYVWVTLPEEVDTSRGSAMFRACVAEGVLYVPGDYCFQPDAAGRVPKNHLRLSFGQVAPEQIEPGIRRLAAVVGRQIGEARSPKPETRNQNDESMTKPE